MAPNKVVDVDEDGGEDEREEDEDEDDDESVSMTIQSAAYLTHATMRRTLKSF